MSADAWMTSYLAGEMAPTAATAVVGEADPMLIVSVAMTALAERGVPLVIEGGALELAAEAAGRLLRAFGIASAETWTVAP